MVDNRYTLKYEENHTKLAVLLSVGLLIVVTLQHTHIPDLPSYAVVLLFYAFVVALYIHKMEVITLPTFYVGLFTGFGVFVLTLSVINPGSLNGAVQLISLLSFTAVNLFLIPQLITFDEFTYVSSRLVALFVLLGFSPYIGITPQYQYFDLSLWGTQLYFLPWFESITSLFTNSNSFGFFALTGTVAASYELWTKKDRVSTLFTVINLIGLIFANYRAGLIALVASYITILSYILFQRKGVIIATVGGIMGVVTTILMIYQILPGPSFLADVSLSHRRTLWRASVQATLDKPLFGHGLGMSQEVVPSYTPPHLGYGTHNSYLRMFVDLGLIGGLLYLSMYVSILIGSAKQATNKKKVTLSAILIAFGAVQLFSSLSFIGISLHSTMIAVLMGYYIHSNTNQ